MSADCRTRVCAVLATFKTLWRVLLAGGIYSFLLFDEADIYISYLRTAVSCNITDQVQGESNTANWSGSTFCYDRNFVIGEATRNQGWLTAMGYALKVCSVFFLGIVADVVGRRITMIVGSVAMCVAFGLLALNSFIDGGASIVLITVSSVIQGLTNPATGGVSPFVTAMIADLSTEKDRGFAMTSYAAVRTMFSLVAFGVGYYILSLEFTDYSLVWAGFAAVAALSAILFIFVVEETLGHQPYLQLRTTDSAAETSGGDEDSARATAATSTTSISQRATTGAGRRLGPNSKTGTTVQPVAQALRKNLCAGCCIVVRSPFLRLYIVSCVLMYCAFGGTFFIAASYLLAQMRWTQANASLALFLQSVATIVGYVVNYSVVGSVRGESYTTFGIGVSGAIVGNLVVGLLSPSHVAGFWVGFMIIGLAYGFALPALPTIASIHADSEEQAQLQSTFTVATMIGLIVASELHTNIYDENAVGVEAGTPFFASSGLLAMSLLIHVLAYHCCRQKTSIGKRRRSRPTRYLATTKATITDSSEDAPTHPAQATALVAQQTAAGGHNNTAVSQANSSTDDPRAADSSDDESDSSFEGLGGEDTV